MKAFIVPVKTIHRQSDVDKFQHQKRIHCKSVGGTQLCELNGVDNLCKDTEMRYKDRRKPDHKFVSPLCKLNALVLHVPHRTKPEVTVPKPVFDDMYVNAEGAHCGTITVMIVSDRLGAWTVYRKIANCLSA